MKTINFRRLEKTPAPYDPTHGLYQLDDGSLIVIGRVPPGEAADKYFEMFRDAKPSMAAESTTILDALKTLGAQVDMGLRMRRVQGSTTAITNKDDNNNGNTSSNDKLAVQNGSEQTLPGQSDPVSEGGCPEAVGCDGVSVSG